jgi:hypothetical protein
VGLHIFQLASTLISIHLTRVTLGDYHFGALTSSGSLLVFGSNEQGQLGIAKPPQPIHFSNETSSPPQSPTHPQHPPQGNLAPAPSFHPTAPMIPPFLRTRIGGAHRPRRFPREVVPGHVETPMKISFSDAVSGGEAIEGKDKRDYVINVAFGGHQSCALVADLEQGDDESEEEKEERGVENVDQDEERGKGTESGHIPALGSRMMRVRYGRALAGKFPSRSRG